jgi:hypothetical protein
MARRKTKENKTVLVRGLMADCPKLEWFIEGCSSSGLQIADTHCITTFWIE